MLGPSFTLNYQSTCLLLGTVDFFSYGSLIMGLDLLFYKNFTHLHHFANAELKSEKKDNSEKQIKTKTPFASFVEPWVLLSLG